MKNIIYICIISAAAALSSCKGSAFLSQRYTHFGHNTVKNTAKERPAATAEKNIQVAALTQAAQPVNDQALAVAGDVRAAAAPKEINQPLAAKAGAKQTFRFPAAPLKDIGSAMASSAKTISKATHKSDAAQAHRGLIFGLINLALFIVIVAVIVVAVILLLALL